MDDIYAQYMSCDEINFWIFGCENYLGENVNDTKLRYIEEWMRSGV